MYQKIFSPDLKRNIYMNPLIFTFISNIYIYKNPALLVKFSEYYSKEYMVTSKAETLH